MWMWSWCSGLVLDSSPTNHDIAVRGMRLLRLDNMLAAILLVGCESVNECDYIAVNGPIRLELYTPQQVWFTIGDLPSGARHHPMLMVSAYGDSNGLTSWLTQPNGQPRPGCSSRSRDDDRSCRPQLLNLTANSSDNFWLSSDAHGDYDLELDLIDYRDQTSVEDPVCKRVVRVQVPLQ